MAFTALLLLNSSIFAFVYVPPAPVVNKSDTVICHQGDSITMSIANPDSVEWISENIGPLNLSIGPFEPFPATTQFLNFTVQTSSARIETMDAFFSGSIGFPYTVIIRNASTLQTVASYSGSVSISSSVTPQVIPINALLVAGNYQIGFSVNPGTYRNKGGAVFPYHTVQNGISITGHTFVTEPSYYYFFYNWKVQYPVVSPSTYTWMPGSMTGQTVKVSPTATTTYTVTSTKQSGASSSSTVKIYYLPVTTPVISANGPTTFCKGGSITLDAGAGYVTYKWMNGAVLLGTSRTLTVAPTSTKTYTVITSDGGPCFSSASTTITILTAGNPPINPTDPAICQGTSVSLDAGNGFVSYSWMKNQQPVGNTQVITTNQAATYSVTVTASNGCSDTKTSSVVVNPNPPVPSVSAADITTLCDNGGHSSVILTADTTGTGPGGNVVWNDLFSNGGSTYNVQWDDYTLQLFGNSYDFSAIVSNAYGCSSTSVPINVNVVHCELPLSLKVFLQGYYLSNGNMEPVLSNQMVNGASASQTDTIYVELRDTENPAKVIASEPVVLSTNGNASCNFICLPGIYWIVIKHRNSVQTWSGSPVALPGSLYDFTNESSKAFGNNMIDVNNEGIWSIYAGDLNQDEFIDIFDFAQYDADNHNFVSFVYSTSDINGDGFVDIFDFPVYDTNNFSFVFSNHP